MTPSSERQRAKAPPDHRSRDHHANCLKRARRREPEIEWTYAPRILPGEYPAISRGARRYFDRQFKRWVCAIQFDVVSESVSMEVIAELAWFLNLGSRAKPQAGRRTNFWAAWVLANGGLPKRGDRLSLKVFIGRRAIVRVGDTSKTHDRGHIEPNQAYSVIREVIEWQTGGGAR